MSQDGFAQTSGADLDRSLREAEELRLTTRGRHTGREHRVTLWFAHEDGALWLRTDAASGRHLVDWYENLRRTPDCGVEVDGHTLRARYEPSADVEADLRHLVALWRSKYGAAWVSDWYVERGRLPVRVRILR